YVIAGSRLTGGCRQHDAPIDCGDRRQVGSRRSVRAAVRRLAGDGVSLCVSTRSRTAWKSSHHGRVWWLGLALESAPQGGAMHFRRFASLVWTSPHFRTIPFLIVVIGVA